jgi:metal-responsive CopG/Arc/MetJ family transcriptional regulator
MRTTVNIDDDLLAEIKVIAGRRHASLGEVVDDALREYLRPGVNWRSISAMLDLMEDL